MHSRHAAGTIPKNFYWKGKINMLSSNSRHGSWRLLSLLFGILVVLTPAARAGFIPIPQPDATYVSSTLLLPITAPDFDVVSSLSNGGFSVMSNIGLVALTTPGTWSSWGSPPDVESSTPRVLWTNGFTSLTLTLSAPTSIFGVEVQPNTAVVSTILASFYAGPNLLGEISLDVDGNAGARLFAASSTTLIDRVVLASTDDFALAQVRVAVPEPGLIPKLIGLGVVGLPLVIIRDRRLRMAKLAEVKSASVDLQ
jgi:hypothetical protein